MSKERGRYVAYPALCAVLWSAAAGAEQVQQPGVLRVEEVIVTATRREESLQNLPMSVSAVSAESLEQMRARSAEDYVLTIPGVSFTNREGSRQSFVVRGVPSLGAGDTTARYLDETPQVVDPRLFDVERVEVLRGPQGTLYGASSMGGALRTITRKPGLSEYELRFDASYSETNEGGTGYDVNAAVNLPLAQDVLALRVVGYRENRPGFVDNYAVEQLPDGTPRLGRIIEKNVGEQEISGGRVMVRFAPMSDLTVDASYYYQRSETSGSMSEDAELGRGALRQSRAPGEGFDEEMSQGNLTVTYDAPFGNLISSTSYSTVDEGNAADVTLIASQFVQLFNMIFGDGRDTSSVAPILLTGEGRSRRFTQEVRLASDGNDRFNWLLGGFYDEIRRSGGQSQFAPGASQFFGPFTPGDTLSKFSSRQRQEELSFFGELSYNLDDRWQATLGVRRYDIKSSFDNFQSGLFAFAGDLNDILIGVPSHGQAREDGFTYKALLSYEIAAGKLLYLQASSGYRPGGPNSFVPPTETPTPVSQYESDKLWQYELGWKSTLWGERATLNGAVFYIDWTDIQSTILTDGGYSFVGNAGAAHSQGLELELQARVTSRLDLGFSASWIDTEFDSGFPVLNVDAGDPLPNIPEFTVNANARYSWPITAQYTGFVFGQYSHVGERVENANQQLKMDAYGRADLRIGARRGTVEVALFANNLFDDRAVVGRFTNFNGERLSYIQPRTIGLSIKGDF